MPEGSISALEQRVRDFINRARKQHALLKDSGAWNQLCSSLDVIGDTELAFDSYAMAPDTEDAGATYILVYGVLQALVLQQDAVLHLAEALGLKYELDPTLKEVREVRNASIGHPTKRVGRARSHFISRIFESIPSGRSPEYGRMHVRLLMEAVARFQSKLADRGVAGAYDSVEYHLDLVTYPLKELDHYFTEPGASRLNERDASIFTQFTQGEIEALRRMAAEIDESYEDKGDD